MIKLHTAIGKYYDVDARPHYGGPTPEACEKWARTLPRWIEVPYMRDDILRAAGWRPERAGNTKRKDAAVVKHWATVGAQLARAVTLYPQAGGFALTRADFTPQVFPRGERLTIPSHGINPSPHRAMVLVKPWCARMLSGGLVSIPDSDDAIEALNHRLNTFFK